MLLLYDSVTSPLALTTRAITLPRSLPTMLETRLSAMAGNSSRAITYHALSQLTLRYLSAHCSVSALRCPSLYILLPSIASPIYFLPLHYPSPYTVVEFSINCLLSSPPSGACDSLPITLPCLQASIESP